jgi:hypothetical protein
MVEWIDLSNCLGVSERRLDSNNGTLKRLSPFLYFFPLAMAPCLRTHSFRLRDSTPLQ